MLGPMPSPIEREIAKARRGAGAARPAPKGGARRHAYSEPGWPRGAKVLVDVPAGFFGRWAFTVVYPGEADVRIAARVFCGADHRLKFKWAKNPGAGVMRVLSAAADRAVADLGGAAKVCK